MVAALHASLAALDDVVEVQTQATRRLFTLLGYLSGKLISEFCHSQNHKSNDLLHLARFDQCSSRRKILSR
jgi:hypothetical protein